MVATLPTACAVGYKYFVGYANWLTGNSKLARFESGAMLVGAIQQIVGRERREGVS
jgi:hypothetical protein